MLSTKNIYDVEKIFDEIKRHLGFRKDVELAEWLGISNQRLWNWKQKNAIVDISLFKNKGFSEKWLRTGQGEMLENPLKVHEENPTYQKSLLRMTIEQKLDKMNDKELEDFLFKLLKEERERED